MASPESIRIAHRVVNEYAGNIHDNMRSSAERYKSLIAGGAVVSDVAALANAEADLYLKLIGRMELYVTDAVRRPKLMAGLSAIGTTQGLVDADIVVLRSAAMAQKLAAKTTGTEINTMADAVLAAVPDWDDPRKLP